MDLPPPATAQLNRFYTVEFFSEVRRALRPGGLANRLDPGRCPCGEPLPGVWP